MNYLAHAYLSFHYPGVLVGNMISDFVKGKKKFDYATDVQSGIHLHRLIDAFTDEHAATREAKQIFKPFVGLYAGAFMDVVYDHFLAKDEHEFPGNGLASFAAETYTTLNEYEPVLPQPFAAMLPYMTTQNWLYNYRNTTGIEKSFGGVVRRAAYLNSSADVYDAFIKNYDSLQEHYAAFFPDVKAFAKEKLDKMV
ncbi:MAG TPA: ACP phosphodiesterase [Chitinophagaceae bacterium]|nr:ACP phosphodiesterase [Chitinophagaceae bacterium]